MNNLAYPNDLLVEIIHKFLEIEVTHRDWLRFRLVSKLFNQHILFTIFVLDIEVIKYVRTPFPQEEHYGTKHEWLPPRFAQLRNSWWLQGQSIKSDTEESSSFENQGFARDRGWWKQLINESACVVTEYIEKTNSNMIDSMIFTGFLGSLSSSTSLKFQKIKELICDAIACLLTIENLARAFEYLQPMFFFKKGWGKHPPEPSERFKWCPFDILFLVACFTKDLSAVKHSLIATHQSHRSLENYDKLRFAGLYVALRQNSRELVSYFLGTGLEITDRTWPYVLCATIQTGNFSMFQFFLHPQFLVRRDLTQLKYVLPHAAEYTNTVLRIEMCKSLLNFYGEEDVCLRTRLLIAACRSDDIAFAKWIFDTGPVTLYNSRDLKRSNPRIHPIMIAVNHGSTNVLRFFLESKFEVFEDNDLFIIHHAFRRAQELGRYAAFMELVPYQTHLSREEMLRHASQVDHVLEAVDKTFGIADVVSKILEEAQDFGSWMLESAVEHQRVANLEWLLEHGFRTKTTIGIILDRLRCHQRPKLKTAVFNKLRHIEGRLRAYNNPGIELKCSYWCTSPVEFSKILQLPRPWDYDCTCNLNRKDT